MADISPGVVVSCCPWCGSHPDTVEVKPILYDVVAGPIVAYPRPMHRITVEPCGHPISGYEYGGWTCPGADTVLVMVRP